MASDEDVRRLADNMLLLDKRGLGKLNKRLIDSKEGVWATIAEHNFAIMLVSELCPAIPIDYEPEGLRRPPDFRVQLGDTIYWIQMKDLSKLARENKREKMIQKIKEATEQLEIGKFYSCTLSEDFKGECLSELIKFIGDKAVSAAEGESFVFGDEHERAEVSFWSPEKIELSHLTLGHAGDLDVVNITGLARDQIKGSLRKAAVAFEWNVDERNINLVVMEADNKDDIDICDALFGTEFDFMANHEYRWSRKDDGLFCDPGFSAKVAGVIAIKRKDEWVEEIAALSPEEVVNRLTLKERAISVAMTAEEIKKALEWKTPGPVADYHRVLYVNEHYDHLLKGVKKLLHLDGIVYFDDRPE